MADFALPCAACGNSVSHHITDELTAHRVIDDWLESRTTALCDACRAMPLPAA